MIREQFVVVCDECGEWCGKPDDLGSAIGLAIAEGWDLDDESNAVCPDCMFPASDGDPNADTTTYQGDA